MKRDTKGWVALFTGILCLSLIATPAPGTSEVSFVGTVPEGYPITDE